MVIVDNCVGCDRYLECANIKFLDLLEVLNLPTSITSEAIYENCNLYESTIERIEV